MSQSGEGARARRFTQPRSGETLESIVKRELGDRPAEAALEELRSWNLHLFARLRPGELLPSDVVFLEPPLAG